MAGPIDTSSLPGDDLSPEASAASIRYTGAQAMAPARIEGETFGRQLAAAATAFETSTPYGCSSSATD